MIGRSNCALVALLALGSCRAELEVRVEAYQGELILSEVGRFGRVTAMSRVALSALIKGLIDTELALDEIRVVDTGLTQCKTPQDRTQLETAHPLAKRSKADRTRLRLQCEHVRRLVAYPIVWVLSQGLDLIDRKLAVLRARSLPTGDIEKYWTSLFVARELVTADTETGGVRRLTRLNETVSPSDYLGLLSQQLAHMSDSTAYLMSPTSFGDDAELVQEREGLLALVAMFAEKLFATKVGLETFDREIQAHIREHQEDGENEPEMHEDHWLTDVVVLPIWHTLSIYYPRVQGMTNFMLKAPPPASISGGSNIEKHRRAQHADIIKIQDELTNRFRQGVESGSKPSKADIREFARLVEAVRQLEGPYFGVQPATAYLALQENQEEIDRQGLNDVRSNWHEVTTVHARASGKSDYAIIQDAIGNWQVKRVRNDATELVNLANSAMTSAIDIAVAQGNAGAYVRNAYREYLENVRSGGNAAAAFETFLDELAKSRKAELDAIDAGSGTDPEKKAAKRAVLTKYQAILRTVHTALIKEKDE